jgi:hypothetical protein
MNPHNAKTGHRKIRILPSSNASTSQVWTPVSATNAANTIVQTNHRKERWDAGGGRSKRVGEDAAAGNAADAADLRGSAAKV